MHFALLYRTAPDYLARRPAFRAAHLALAERERAAGRLLLAGAFDPADGALLVFRAEGREAVEAFVREDPYVQNGLVTSFEIKAWTVVVGG